MGTSSGSVKYSIEKPPCVMDTSLEKTTSVEFPLETMSSGTALPHIMVSRLAAGLLPS